MNSPIPKSDNSSITEEETTIYNYKDDPENPLNWSKRKKYSGFSVVFLMSFMGYFSSAVYIPALSEITIYFNTTATMINATVALYILMNAIAPLFLAPLSERIGRRWIYISCMSLYTVCCIVCGISRNLGLFFAFRLLQGIFGSVGQAIGAGSVSDLFELHERGKAMGFYQLGVILGSAIGPVIGGYVDQYLGWRWIFYLKTIIGGVITILAIVFVQETFYRPGKNMPATSFREHLERFKFNPFVSLRLLLYPEVGLACIPTGLAFGWYYYLATSIPTLYASIYGFATGSIGLCFLAGGVGNVLGSTVAGFSSDRLYARMVTKNNGIELKEFRLKPIYLGVVLYFVGSILYGWLLEYHIFWFVPLVSFSFVAFGLMFTVTMANTYLVDAHIKTAASAVSSSNFTRNTCAMIFSLAAVSIRDSLGNGWSYVLMGLMTTASFLICIPLIQRYGVYWRENRTEGKV